MKRLLLTLTLLASSGNAFAWGQAGHLIVNEAATLGLPTDMPQFFYRSYPDLVWLAYDPDRIKGAGPSIDAVNEPDHFIDYEFTAGLTLPPDRYDFIDLMYSSGRLRQKGITNSETGFLPWRIAEMSEQLTSQFRQWRFSVPRSSERAALERDIIHTAGVLGHFAGDSSQPLHDTINYNGWTSPNPNGYSNDCDTHGEFEGQFVSHSISVGDVVPKLAPPIRRTEYFDTAIGAVKQGNAQVERLYQLDRDGKFNLIGRPPAEGVSFVTGRLAAGASLLRDLWWSAWKNSENPPPRRASGG